MRRAPILLGAFAPFLAVSVVHLSVKLAGLVEVDRATKGLLVPSLALGAAVVLLAGRLRMPWPSTALLFAALALSWLGDVVLGESFLLGLASFLAAHLAYIVLFHRTFPRRMSWWAIGLVPWFAGLVLALSPYLGELIVPVALYGAVLCYMAAAATRGNAFTMIGGALFVASDSLLAFRLFTPLFQTPPEDALIMTLYLGAQLCIVAGALRTARPRADAGADGARASEPRLDLD